MTVKTPHCVRLSYRKGKSGTYASRWRTSSGSICTSKPATSAFPELGLMRPVRTLMVVVLPAALGPSTAKNSPGRTVRLRPSTATRSPNFFTMWTSSIMALRQWRSPARMAWPSSRCSPAPGLHQALHPLPARNEWGEDRGEGKPIKTRLLPSPLLHPVAERENRSTRFRQSRAPRLVAARDAVFPLPEGEGKGEGQPDVANQNGRTNLARSTRLAPRAGGLCYPNINFRLPSRNGWRKPPRAWVFRAFFPPHPGPIALELGESTALFSLSSDAGGGEGRGEESRFYWISPLPNPPPARSSQGEGDRLSAFQCLIQWQCTLSPSPFQGEREFTTEMWCGLRTSQ